MRNEQTAERRAGTDAIWIMMLFRLIAFGRCSRGTRFGVSAWRAGTSNAPAAELTAVST